MVCPEAIAEVPEVAAEPSGNTCILEKFMGYRHDTHFLWTRNPDTAFVNCISRRHCTKIK